jgi:hypothetical protein
VISPLAQLLLKALYSKINRTKKKEAKTDVASDRDSAGDRDRQQRIRPGLDANQFAGSSADSVRKSSNTLSSLPSLDGSGDTTSIHNPFPNRNNSSGPVTYALSLAIITLQNRMLRPLITRAEAALRAEAISLARHKFVSSSHHALLNPIFLKKKFQARMAQAMVILLTFGVIFPRTSRLALCCFVPFFLLCLLSCPNLFSSSV